MEGSGASSIFRLRCASTDKENSGVFGARELCPFIGFWLEFGVFDVCASTSIGSARNPTIIARAIIVNSRRIPIPLIRNWLRIVVQFAVENEHQLQPFFDSS